MEISDYDNAASDYADGEANRCVLGSRFTRVMFRLQTARHTLIM